MKNLVFGIVIFLVFVLTGCSFYPDATGLPGEEGITAANDAFPPGFIPETGMTKIDKVMGGNLGSRAPASKILNVPRKIQERSYWCGPASIQMIQYYFNMPASQSTIASYCGTNSSVGTYVYKIVNWLNAAPMTGYASLPSWWVWEYVTVTSTTDFINKIHFTIGNYSAPQIWHLKTYPSSVYHLPGYTGNYGHYIVGSGYDSNNNVLEDDPWYGNGGGSNIWVSGTTMYNCIKANASLIIY
jgi:hypothetical protein